MESSKFAVLFKRFLRGFAAGGIAAVASQLATTVTLHSIDDLKKLGASLAIAFITGGLLATEKAIRWVEPDQPEPLINEPTGQN